MKDEAPSRRAAWALRAGPLLLNLLVFGPVYAGISSFYWRDILTNYIPNLAWLTARITAGDLPLWNDRIVGGMPFWGDPVQAVLYPGHILLLLLKNLHPAWSFSVFAGVHYLAAQLGYIRLFRKLGCRSWVAFIGSAALVYGAVGLALHTAVQFLCAFTWLGWVAAALLDHLRRPDARSTLVLSLWTALIVTTGDLQAAYLLGLLALAASEPWRRGNRRKFLLTGAAFGLAGVLSAAAIVPGFELSWNSARARTNTAGYVQSWSWNPARVIEWFAPALIDPPDGAAIHTEKVSRPGSEGQGPYFPRAAPGYLCLMLLPLAVLAARTDRRVRWLIACAGLALLMAAGDYLGIYGIAYRAVPGWNQFRFPERLFLHFLMAAYGAGILSLELLLRGTVNVPNRLLPLVWIVPAALVTGAGLADAALWPGLLGVPVFPAYVDYLHGVFAESLLLLGAAAAGWFLLVSGGRERTAAWALGGLVLLELVIAGLPVLRQVPLAAFPQQGILDRAVAARFARDSGEAGIRTVPPRIHIEFDRETRGEGSRLTRAALDWQRLPGDLIMLTPYSMLGGYNSSLPLDQDLASKAILGATGSRLQSLDYLVTGKEQGVESSQFDCGAPIADLPVKLCRFKSALLPVRAPRRWATGVSERALSDPAWDPAAGEYLGRLSGKPSPDAPERSGEAASVADGTARIRVTEWKPELRRIEVERGEDGPVVTRDNYFPGWNVYVNGVRGTTLCANGFQLAAWVPKGRSAVEFRYEPVSVTAGLWITVLSFVATIAGLLAARHKA